MATFINKNNIVLVAFKIGLPYEDPSGCYHNNMNTKETSYGLIALNVGGKGYCIMIILASFVTLLLSNPGH